jgi:NAD(P)-dependent dehydrogenase (short-subunit alcohol dehydrogenase family)
MGRIKGRVIFLTGDGGVLGRASAWLFAREGTRLVLVAFFRETADQTVVEIEREGREALALRADFTREEEVAEAVAATVGRWGGIDGLFNNAGIMPHEDVSVLDMENEIWSRVYATNVWGTALCSKHAIPASSTPGVVPWRT